MIMYDKMVQLHALPIPNDLIDYYETIAGVITPGYDLRAVYNGYTLCFHERDRYGRWQEAHIWESPMTTLLAFPENTIPVAILLYNIDQGINKNDW